MLNYIFPYFWEMNIQKSQLVAQWWPLCPARVAELLLGFSFLKPKSLRRASRMRWYSRLPCLEFPIVSIDVFFCSWMIFWKMMNMNMNMNLNMNMNMNMMMMMMMMMMMHDIQCSMLKTCLWSEIPTGNSYCKCPCQQVKIHNMLSCCFNAVSAGRFVSKTVGKKLISWRMPFRKMLRSENMRCFLFRMFQIDPCPRIFHQHHEKKIRTDALGCTAGTSEEQTWHTTLRFSYRRDIWT